MDDQLEYYEMDQLLNFHKVFVAISKCISLLAHEPAAGCCDTRGLGHKAYPFPRLAQKAWTFSAAFVSLSCPMASALGPTGPASVLDILMLAAWLRLQEQGR
jgi:hypothetical protein